MSLITAYSAVLRIAALRPSLQWCAQIMATSFPDEEHVRAYGSWTENLQYDYHHLLCPEHDLC